MHLMFGNKRRYSVSMFQDKEKQHLYMYVVMPVVNTLYSSGNCLKFRLPSKDLGFSDHNTLYKEST